MSIELIQGGNNHPSTSATLQVWLFNLFESTRSFCEERGIGLSLTGKYAKGANYTQIDLRSPLTLHKVKSGKKEYLQIKPTDSFISELIKNSNEFSEVDRQKSFSASSLNDRFRKIQKKTKTSQNGWKFFQFQIEKSSIHSSTTTSCVFKLTFRGHLEENDQQITILKQLQGFMSFAKDADPDELVHNLFSFCKQLEFIDNNANSSEDTAQYLSSNSLSTKKLTDFPTPETIWNWIVDHRGNKSPMPVPSPGPKNLTYPNISIDLTKQQISGATGKRSLETKWHTLLKSNFITPIDQKAQILKMWAFGWNSLAGLVDNKSFPYEANSTTFHLRYIPVDFNLFDSVMAELNLRRQSNKDPDIAIYKQSEWGSKKDTSSWWVEVSKSVSQTGFDVIIKEKVTAQEQILLGSNTRRTTVDLGSGETVKQFADYDWSTRNANTLEGETHPRFYVSWPEKMLLQEFLKGKLKNLDLDYKDTPPQVWWASFLGASSTSYNTLSLQSTSPYVGVGCNLLDTDWSALDTDSPNPALLVKLHPSKFSSTYIPFLLYIRPGDYCYNMSSKQHYSVFSSIDFNNPSWQNDLCTKTNNHHIFRPLKEWTQQTEHTTFHNIQKQINTTLPVNRQSIYGLGSLKTKWDNTEINFTDGFAHTEEYTPLYKDFIEQRAKVLDPTSRALLIYLRYNTPNPGDDPVTIIRHPDYLPTNKDLCLPNKLMISKNIILEGVPGTGKTFAFNKVLAEQWEHNWPSNTDKRSCKTDAITMHPSTSYEDFLEGLRPKSIQPMDPTTGENELDVTSIQLQETKDIDTITIKNNYFYNPVGLDTVEDIPTSNFTVADGFFLNVCKHAVQNPSKDYLVLLDEINRCNIPSVFGDLLTAIERSKRATWDNDKQCWDLSNAQTITLAISKRKFFVPENVYVVGTMNTTDRSVAPMDMALRRRFAFHRIEPVAPDITNSFKADDFPNLDEYQHILGISIEALESLNGIADRKDKNKTVLAKWGSDALIGYSYIYDLASDLEQYHSLGEDTYEQLLKHHWNHHILPQLADIVFSNQISRGKQSDLNTLLKNTTSQKSIKEEDKDHTITFTISDTTLGSDDMMDRPRLTVSIEKRNTPKEKPSEAGDDGKSENDVDTLPKE